MKTHPHLHTLTLLLSTLTLALSATLRTSPLYLPPAVDLPASNGTTSLSAKGNVHCSATIPFSPFYLTMHGCAAAINEIPDNQTIGDFHTGDPFNDFSLPFIKTVGYCKVKVEMVDLGQSDQSSWLQVNLAATKLNLQCASRYKYRYQGGWRVTGMRDGIKVSLSWWSAEGGSRNETMVEGQGKPEGLLNSS